MHESVRDAVETVFTGSDLSADQMQAAIAAIMDGECDPLDTAALLTSLRVKGEAVSELVGAARAMRERATPIQTRHSGLLDTCGTGGDKLHTFNISTATAIVAAACGVPVAKHGNRSVSSSSGSADVLEALGVNIQLTPQQVGRCLDEVGIAFCFAPLIHGAMKHAAPVRRQLEFRTVFNLLGPLTNPAGADYQLLGVNEPVAAGKVAQALAQLPVKNAIVVCGNGELDEVSLWGPTVALFVSEGSVIEKEWVADSFGLPECHVSDLTVESDAESARVINDVFGGKTGPARDIVVANTAAALLAAQKFQDPGEAARFVETELDAGKAATITNQLIAASKS
jgi:anthranilate phosphoribosyltransferase